MRFLTGDGGFMPQAVFEGEGGGEEAAAAAAAAAAAGGGGGDWTPPEGLPDAFKGADANETLGKVLTGYTEANTRAEGLRTKLAGLPAAPKTADEYSFEPTDDTKPWFGDMDKNPIMPVARAAAHKLGLSNEQFGGFINEVYGEAAKNGLILPPLDPAGEIKSYMTAAGLKTEAEAGDEFKANEIFAKGLLSQLKGLPEDENTKAAIEGQLLALTDTHEGNLLLKAMSARLADSGLRVSGEAVDAGGAYFAKDQLRAMSADPKADPQSKEFDKAFQEKLDKSYAHHHSSAKTDD